MDKELLGKFLKDFHIVTQDEDQEFPYANPSDASRSLIKARNWIGTLTERLMDLQDSLKDVKVRLSRTEASLVTVERKILAASSPVPSWATKNKEIQKAYILSNATDVEKQFIAEFEKNIAKDKDIIYAIESEIEQYYTLIKHLDRSTEWIIQYINWMKYEARSFNG